MPSLSALVTNFVTNERPAGNILDEPGVLAQAIAAASFVAGYMALSAHAGVSPVPAIGGDTVVSLSEWALIRPLFLLYIEREQTMQLEATRVMGLDVFGRSSSEISGDITQLEAEIPRRAFFQGITTI